MILPRSPSESGCGEGEQKIIKEKTPSAMALLHRISILAFFVLILVSSQGTASDPCARTDFKSLCRAISKGERTPSGATSRAIRASIAQATKGKTLAGRLSRSARSKIEKSTASTCKGLYEDIISDLSQSVGDLRARDFSGLNDKFSAVLANIDACNEGYVERGRASPFSRLNLVLRQHASNCLALSSALHRP